jgi:hypothetical protein
MDLKIQLAKAAKEKMVVSILGHNRLFRIMNMLANHF